MEHFFSPKSIVNLRLDAHNSQIIGGDAGVDHTQTIGGNTVKLLGGYIPPSSPGFGTPARCITSKYATSLRGLFRVIAPEQHSFFQRNVAAVASLSTVIEI